MRYDLITVSGSAFDNFDFLIGKYDDNSDSSVKWFFNENGGCEKVIRFDGDVIFFTKMQIPKSLVESLLVNNLSESQIKELINKLIAL